MDQKAALDNADEPGALNPFATKKQLPTGEPPHDWPIGVSMDQKAALDNADRPGPENPVVTCEQWRLTAPTEEQKNALAAAQNPHGKNPFVTESRLTQWTGLPAHVIDGLLNADQPAKTNPFVTNRQLPDGDKPTTWPIGVTGKQKEALDESENPGTGNPFITKSRLQSQLPIGVTDPQKKALEASENPDTDNPFITQSKLTSQLPIGLTDRQKEALDAAENPGTSNPLITQTRLTSQLPLGVTPNQRMALDAANSPGPRNPVATMADLALIGVTMRVAAAGSLNLGVVGVISGKTMGGLTVVEANQAQGLSTLSFENYRFEAHDTYVVKALPINSQVGQDLRQCTVATFVEFNDQGFVLHMCQPLAEKVGLGPCMVEVSEMITAEIEPLSIDQAITYYYTLIQQKRFEEAWPMLSTRFKNSLQPPLRTYEDYVAQWERSGSAIITGREQVESSANKATFILDLDYPKAIPAQRKHRIRYEFERSEQEGHRRFNYWLFVGGRHLQA
jgi:hypothetical protein